MKRSLHCAVSLLALSAAIPTFAADYQDDFAQLRPSYEQDFGTGESPLRFESGLRYWYSWGEQNAEIGGYDFGTKDRSQILEGHFRIDDDYTSTFVKAKGGYSFYTTGEYDTSFGQGPTFQGGQIGYLGGDFGYTPFGNESFNIGGLLGYEFNRESPDRNRLDVFNVDGLNIQSLRLGLTAHADLNEFFDIDAEVVAVPYAFAHGATAEIPFADTMMSGTNVNRTQFEATGALYGASGQVMVGFHPTENLTVRLGGRAWMLTGPSSMRQRWWDASTPESYLFSDDVLSGFSLVRYGALAELTGRF